MESRPRARLALLERSRRMPASSAWCATSTVSTPAEPALHRAIASRAASAGLIGDDRVQFRLRLPAARAERPTAPILVVCNMTPVPRHSYRIGVPRGGGWREIVNTDSRFYGGSELGNDGASIPHLSRRARRAPIGRADPAALATIILRPTAESMASAGPTRCPALPYPLGATWDGLGTNFAVFSATRRKASSFACSIPPAAARSRASICRNAPTRSGTAICPNARTGLIYGYRAHGPYEPQHGHRFNPHKLLLDPYARRLAGELRSSDALFGYRVNSPRADLSFDRRDSAPGMLKAVVSRRQLQLGRRPAAQRAVVRHRHLRGPCARPDHAAPRPAAQRARHLRGAGATPHVIDHLRRLGVTAVELLPVHAFVQDRTLLQKGLRNYWGYNTIGFFASSRATSPMASRRRNAHRRAPAARRRHRGHSRRRLQSHRRGQRVRPDAVVPRARQCQLLPAGRRTIRRHCVNDTGTGNTLNLSHPRVLQMVMDSLRYWVTVVPCRRLSLRSRRDPGPRGPWLRSAVRASSTPSARIRSCPGSS